ncbi:MAG: lipopolysaccharide biosynthesis protein [Armatimonadota bacterium]
MDRDSVAEASGESIPTEQGRRAARNTLWSGSGQIVVAAIGVVWLFTVPRLMGPSDYGLFVLIGSLVDFHTMACCLGVNSVFAYHYPRLRQRNDLLGMAQLTTSYSLLIGLTSALGTIVLVVAALLLEGDIITNRMLILAVVGALLQGANGLMGGILYGQNRIAAYAGRFPLQQGVSLALVLAGAVLWQVEGALAGMAGANAITTLWLTYKAKPWREMALSLAPWRELRGAMGFGIMAIFGSLGGLTITRGGNLVLAAVGRSPAEIASFAIAVGFVLQGTSLLSALATAITPGLAELHAKGDEDRARDWATRAATYQTFAAIIATAFVIFLGQPFLSAALGNKYPNVFAIMLLSIGGLLALAQTSLANQLAVAWGHPRLSLENWGVLAFIFVLAVGGLGSAYGGPGAAAGLFLAAWISTLYAGERLRRLDGPAIWNARVVKLVLVALPALALPLLAHTLLLKVLLFLVFLAYLLIMAVALRTIPRGDLNDLRQALSRRKEAEQPG